MQTRWTARLALVAAVAALAAGCGDDGPPNDAASDLGSQYVAAAVKGLEATTTALGLDPACTAKAYVNVVGAERMADGGVATDDLANPDHPSSKVFKAIEADLPLARELAVEVYKCSGLYDLMEDESPPDDVTVQRQHCYREEKVPAKFREMLAVGFVFDDPMAPANREYLEARGYCDELYP
jgi:hypothetical protein